MRVVVTGAGGFIGKNLVLRLQESKGLEIIAITRGDTEAKLDEAASVAHAVVHLAGENRPALPVGFELVNAGFTRALCANLAKHGNRCPVILASSIQAELDNAYGRSKLAAEDALEALSYSNGNPVAILRLPGVFGKWCRPNYNSVVATFCHNVANDLPLEISDPSRIVRLVYIDDTIDAILHRLQCAWTGVARPSIAPEFSISLGELAAQIEAFRNCRTTLISERVGKGLTRALYATYVSYLPKSKFAYSVPIHSDSRGIFVEMLKTADSGQFSFFTALPGATRGSHYHHTKTEKFLVIRGIARFGFRHMLTGELYRLEVSGAEGRVVETVPGWAHDITNIGDEEMIVMLWANENFDRAKPDTIAGKV